MPFPFGALPSPGPALLLPGAELGPGRDTHRPGALPAGRRMLVGGTGWVRRGE